MPTPDVRSALVFDTRDIARRPGTMVSAHRSAPAPDELGTEVMAVPSGDPLEIELRWESVMEGLLASGTVRARALGACVRCLDPVEADLDAPFQELFAYPDRASHHAEAGQDEDDAPAVVVDGLVDLEPVVRDALVPLVPFQPVCRPDCPGLCAQCGARLEDDPDHDHDVIDPRWAALESLARPTHQEKRN